MILTIVIMLLIFDNYVVKANNIISSSFSSSPSSDFFANQYTITTTDHLIGHEEEGKIDIYNTTGHHKMKKFFPIRVSIRQLSFLSHPVIIEMRQRWLRIWKTLEKEAPTGPKRREVCLRLAKGLCMKMYDPESEIHDYEKCWKYQYQKCMRGK